MTNKSPCLGCQERQPGCHATCEAGITYSKRCKVERQRIKAERSREGMINNYKCQRIIKTKRRCGLG